MLIPTATYRLQFSKDFTFRQALGIGDYLADLGISTVYASPILEAFPGSSHGYDVTDFSRINPELGTMQDLEDLVKGLQQRGISWIQDLVPNHMNFSVHNRRLWDVLEKGRKSAYAPCFDIDWDHPLFGGRLLVPLLDSGLQEAIDAKRFRLAMREDTFALDYNGQYFPLNEASVRFLSTVYFSDGPGETDQILLRMASLSHDLSLIQDLLGRQHYLLAPYWATNREINYRRFFAINSLIGLRMEDPAVFDDYHRLTLGLYRKGWIQGLRIDHIDGLKDPYAYIERLRAAFGADCYIIAEKILETKEELPPGLDIQGTSGYEFLSSVNQVFTDVAGGTKLLQFYREMVPECSSYEDIVFAKKRAYLRFHMNGEWNNLVRLLLDKGLVAGVLADNVSVKEALGILIACFPVYRVYIRDDPHSRKWLSHAFREAIGRAPDLFFPLSLLQDLLEKENTSREGDRLEFLRRLMQLTGAIAAKGVEDTTFYCYNPLISHNEVGDTPGLLGLPIDHFHQKMAERRQNYPFSLNCTSTHDTKRGEDARTRIDLISERAAEWTSLVRSWRVMNDPFRTIAGGKGKRAPSVNDEYFIYQSILGAFPETGESIPLFSQRTKEYIRKALREAGVNSAHSAPDAPYESACMAFIDHLFDPSNKFVASLQAFLKEIDGFAEKYTLAMVALKTTLPGIPDFYQGSELWDLNYVDPDNRRTVCFDRRQRLLADLRSVMTGGQAALGQWLRATREQGGRKFFATRTLLHFRKRHPELFVKGDYLPLGVPVGKVLAYARRWRDKWALVIIPLGAGADAAVEAPGAPAKAPPAESLRLNLPPEWPTAWKHLFTGQSVTTGKGLDLNTLTEAFPVVVLESEST